VAVPVDPRLREQYEVERALADRLRSANKGERRGMYREVYDELFRRLEDHPQHRQAADRQARAHEVSLQLTLLRPFTDRETRFLEVGAGDCALSLEMARHVQHVTAVDASAEIASAGLPPDNFRLVLADGPPLPLEDGSVDLAYSCHFIEHLHPEDAHDHLSDVRRLLAVGGRCVVVTPNRLLGPHDISKHFDRVATGLHLREYSNGDLTRLLRRTGFRRIRALRGVGKPPVPCPPWPVAAMESVLEPLPKGLRLGLLRFLRPSAEAPFRPLEQVVLVAKRDG
jgi:SAM-dependent methyltransferase